MKQSQEFDTNLSASHDSPNRCQEFAKLIKERREKIFNNILQVFLLLMAIADICILFSPLAIYSNGTTVSKEEHYSMITILLESSKNIYGSEKTVGLDFLIGSALASLGNIFAMLRTIQFIYAENEKTTKKNFALALIASLASVVGIFVALSSFISLPNDIAHAMGLSNPYWKLSYGWGGFVTLGLLFVGASCALPCIIMMFSLKWKYVNGTYTEADILKYFPQAKETNDIKKSVSEQLKELDQLKKDGLISEADYEEKKKQILNL